MLFLCSLKGSFSSLLKSCNWSLLTSLLEQDLHSCQTWGWSSQCSFLLARMSFDSNVCAGTPRAFQAWISSPLITPNDNTNQGLPLQQSKKTWNGGTCVQYLCILLFLLCFFFQLKGIRLISATNAVQRKQLPFHLQMFFFLQCRCDLYHFRMSGLWARTNPSVQAHLCHCWPPPIVLSPPGSPTDYGTQKRQPKRSEQ